MERGIALAVEGRVAEGRGASDSGCGGGGAAGVAARKGEERGGGSVPLSQLSLDDGEEEETQEQLRVLYETQGLSGLLGSSAMHFERRDPVLTCRFLFTHIMYVYLNEVVVYIYI